MIPRMDGELSNRRRVPAETRRWQEIQLCFSTKRTVDEQRPARGKHLDIFGKRGPASIWSPQKNCFIRKLVGRNFFRLDGPHSPRAGLAGRPEKYEYPPIQDSSRLSLVDGRAPDWPEADQANRGACGRRRSSDGG